MSDNNTNELDNIIQDESPFTAEELELLVKNDPSKEDNDPKINDDVATEIQPEIMAPASAESQDDGKINEGTQQPKDGVSPSAQEQNEIEVYYNYLIETGALTPPEDFEFDGSEEGLKEAIQFSEQYKQEQAIVRFVESLPADYAEAIRFAAQTGQPLNAYLQNTSTIDFSSLDLEDLDTQKEVIRSYYKIQNPSFSDEKIDKFLARLPEQDIQGEAEEALDYLAQFQQAIAEQQRVQQEKAAEQALEQYAQYQQSVNSAIDESDFIQGRRKNQLKAFVWNEIQRDDTVDTEVNRRIQSLASNPEHYVMFLDLLYDYDPEKGFNFAKIIDQGKKQATTDFRRSLSNRLNSARGSVSNRTPIDPQVNKQPEN